MFSPQPVPDGLLKRALDTAFTTESWPEWDSLNIVPEFDGDVDLDGFDDSESAYEEATEDLSENPAENPAESQTDPDRDAGTADAADPWGDTNGAGYDGTDYDSGTDHLDPSADIDLDGFDF